MKLVLIALALILGQASAQASVWSTTRPWDASAEAEFGNWIANLPTDIFTNPGSKWAGISTDCADAAYSLRIIFAYEHGLPIAFEGGFSNTVGKFDSIGGEKARVMAFIRWVNQGTGTASVSHDTYPLAISPATIRPGTLFVHAATNDSRVSITYRSGHVYYLKDVNTENGLITYMSSTVPAEVRNLNLQYGIDFAPQQTTSGYRAWKWPNTSARPGMSNEQYQIGGWYPGSYGDVNLWDSWQEAVQSRLRSRPMDRSEKLSIAEANLKNVLDQRAQAVTRAWNFYQKRYHGSGCMSAGDYENYSTSTRDTKVQEAISNFRSSGGSTFEYRVGRSATLDFEQIYNLFMTKKVLEISEPEHSPEVRWGIQDQGAWVCPQRASQYSGGNTINPY